MIKLPYSIKIQTRLSLKKKRKKKEKSITRKDFIKIIFLKKYIYAPYPSLDSLSNS